MRPRRPTIAGLLFGIAFLALVLTALREGSAFWEGIVFLAMVLALLTSVLLAVLRVGTSRAFWLGFAVFGGAYFFASQTPASRVWMPFFRWLSTLTMRYERRIILSDIADPALAESYRREAIQLGGHNFVDSGTGKVGVVLPILSPITLRIIHSLLTTVAGMIGGLYAVFLACAGNRRTVADEGDPARP
jgi:hypothetical protein